MVIFEQCKTAKHDECPYILGDEKCGCEHHLNVANTTAEMDKIRRQQQAKQDKIEPITPNEPHIA